MAQQFGELHKPFTFTRAISKLGLHGVVLNESNIRLLVKHREPESRVDEIIASAKHLEHNGFYLKNAGFPYYARKADCFYLKDYDFNFVIAHPSPHLVVQAMIELNKHRIFYPKFFEVISSPDITDPVFATTTLVNLLTKPTPNRDVFAAIDKNPNPKDLIRAMMLFVENGLSELVLFFQAARYPNPMDFAQEVIKSYLSEASSAMEACHAQRFFAAPSSEKKVRFSDDAPVP